MEDIMADEVSVPNGTTTQNGATDSNSKSESEVLRKMEERMAQLAKQVSDQKTFIDRQSNEIGELRKKVAPSTDEGNKEVKPVVNVADEVTGTKPPEVFDFTKLPPSEQDAIKVYMREHLSKLPDAEKKVAKETLRDMANFNELAKEVHGKLKTPKHIEEVLGDEPVTSKEKTKNVSAEIMDAIKAELKLVDIEKNAMPPSGGASRGTVIPAMKPTTTQSKRKFANGGILSLTQN